MTAMPASLKALTTASAVHRFVETETGCPPGSVSCAVGPPSSAATFAVSAPEELLFLAETPG